MNIRKIVACLVAWLPLLLSAQGFRYSLPSTTVVLEVKTVRETFTPGPYARYAEQLLGVKARTEAGETVRITEIRMTPAVEADPSTAYQVSSQAAADRFLSFSSQGLVAFGNKQAETEELVWRFPAEAAVDYTPQSVTAASETQTRTVYKEIQTDTALVRIPVQEQVKVRKSEEKRAEEAAATLLQARRERFNIATGNTDATFSGEALGSALEELGRVEKEYMALFFGTTVTEERPETYEVIPSRSARSQRYTAFLLGEKTYTLEFTPTEIAEPQEEAVAKAREFIHYRIPAVCSVRLTDGSTQYFQARIPVYQLGRDCTCPVMK